MDVDVTLFAVAVLALPIIGGMVRLQVGRAPVDPARVRLAIATVAAFVSVLFVLGLSRATTVIARKQGLELVTLSELYLALAPYASLVVLGLLFGGRWSLRQGARAPVWIELLTGCGWLFAFTWALGCILAWRLQELPPVHLAD